VPEYFNPYHQWLGLDASSPAPHQLLGLSRGETDIATIQRAAEQARGRVLAHSPGPHVAQWTQLLAEIEAAKTSLLAGARARVPMPAPTAAVPMPSGGLHRPAPRPKAAESGVPVAAPVPAPGPTSTAAPFSASRRTKVKARRAKRSSNLVTLAWMVGGLMLLAAVVLPLTVALTTRDTSRNRSNRVQVAAPSPQAPLPRPTAETLPKPRRPVRTETSSARMSPSVQPGEELPDVAEPKEQEVPGPIEPTQIVPQFGKDAIGNPPPAGPIVVAGEPSPPMPPDPTGTRAGPTADQIQQLSRALADARQALERDRFDEALTRLSAVQNSVFVVSRVAQQGVP
jgi:hypothetical protein